MLMEGAWPQGERLEAMRLADDLGVSMTPVRDCLNRLVGERLVDMKPGEGYRTARISEQALRDMLSVNVALLDLALSTQPIGQQPVSAETGDGTYADRMAGLFDAIASRSGNVILAETVRSLSERFHVARMIDQQVFDDSDQELAEMESLFQAQAPEIRHKIRNYSARRSDYASDIVRLIA
jgi:DNA-binding GntR family transcriptional regulator